MGHRRETGYNKPRMIQDTVFPPPKTPGVLLHVGGVLLLGGAAGASVYLALQQQVGSYSALLLLLSLALLLPIGLGIYRGLALLRASYTLERDGLRLRWGLRSEDIPLPEVEWVRPASDMGFSMPLPFLPFPGAILGTRVVEGLGPVEYMASDYSKMLLLATPEKIYVISPADPKSFQRAFQRTIEMGSLTPIPAYSTQPAAFLQRVWSDLPARTALLAGLALTIALFVLVATVIPTRASLPLGFDKAGQPMAGGPPERLLLLPVLATFSLVIDLAGGMFFYRYQDTQPIAYLLWTAGALTPLLLIAATLLLI